MNKQIALLVERTASRESLIQKNRTTKYRTSHTVDFYLIQSLKQNQSIAKTRALREYRQEGFACNCIVWSTVRRSKSRVDLTV